MVLVRFFRGEGMSQGINFGDSCPQALRGSLSESGRVVPGSESYTYQMLGSSRAEGREIDCGAKFRIFCSRNERRFGIFWDKKWGWKQWVHLKNKGLWPHGWFPGSAATVILISYCWVSITDRAEPMEVIEQMEQLLLTLPRAILRMRDT